MGLHTSVLGTGATSPPIAFLHPPLAAAEPMCSRPFLGPPPA